MRRFVPVPGILGVVLLSAVLGGVYGGRVLATEDRLSERQNVFSAALSAIESRYVDEKVDADRLVYSAIGGMLQTLDPHSSFMDPKQYAQLRERQEGHYYGLGISINVVDGNITVMSLFEGSPAYQKGMRRGDVIARIDGEDAKGWTSDQAVQKLRGPKGSPVRVSVRRGGYDQLIELEILRDEINIPSVPAAFMTAEGTAYIRLQEFAENTDRDLSRALKQLTGQGMRRLLLDLRGNPGGPLDQAIKVASHFLPRGDMIVYTRGRVPNSAQDYRAVESSDFTEVPLVVLVNRDSASASEIVAGALQDHDRALIVGETTFGKALVQSVYRISQGAGLALTTARYYTPSHRLIQRPWDNTFDEYLTYRLRDQNPEKSHSSDDMRLTDIGRKVFSGGGIEPDRHVDGPIEGFNPSRFGRSVYARLLFSNYAQKFDREGDTRIASAEGSKIRRNVQDGFVVDDAMLQDFQEYARSQMGTQFDAAAFQADLQFIRAMVRYEIDVATFDVATARRHLLEGDPQAQVALGLFGEAESLLKASHAGASKAAAN